MDEPSVLDYVKEKLIFWRKGQLTIPPGEDEVPVKVSTPSAKTDRSNWLKLLVFLPPILAIIAQMFCEPEGRSKGIAIFFYAFAILVYVVLILIKKWEPSSLLPDQEESGPFSVRWIQFLIGSVLSVLAFFFFTGNLFNLINVSIWIAGQILVWRSLFVPENWFKKIKQSWQRFITDGIQISPWTLLVFGVFLITAFYRLYMLEQVPPEMFSDHAEKLIDVTNVLRGENYIFFPRNTGREAFQMYLTAAMARIFGTGLSFTSLKLGTCLVSLFSLPFYYLLGKEIKNKEVGLLAMFFAGIAYWPNVIARVALRFALYPAFVAPTLFFLVRGLKKKRWNDFLFAGLALGIGLHGYSPFRIVPFAVILVLLIYFIHTRSRESLRTAVIALLLVGFISLLVFLPLGRFAMTNLDMFTYRMSTRMTDVEIALPGTFMSIFMSNLWKALIMFQWDNGQIWVHSIPDRPALGIISAAMFSLGVVLTVIRYLKTRNWIDLSLLLLIPLLMLPSILSIAFPAENPSLNRSGGAMIPVFLIIALFVENLAVNLKSLIKDSSGKWFSTVVVLILAVISMQINGRLVFVDFYREFRIRAWNTSEIGAVIREFSSNIGDDGQAWVVPYTHWVDTRLVGIHALGEVRDMALWQHDLEYSKNVPAPKLFIYKPEDDETLRILQELYPNGATGQFDSEVEGRDFMLYYVLQ